MKTLGRVLIILVVFSALSALMVLTVNASGTSAVPADFNGEPPQQFRPQGDGDDGAFRPERHDRDGGGGGSRWMFGLVKNVGVMAMLVVLIVLPRSIAKKKKRQAAVNLTNSQT